MKVLLSSQIKSAEDNAVKNGNFSYGELMKKAGDAASREILNRYNLVGKKICVLCGNGNNGGDGLVIASNLKRNGADVFLLTPIGFPSTDTALLFKDSVSGIKILDDFTADFDVVIDALFGIGLNRFLSENLSEHFNNTMFYGFDMDRTMLRIGAMNLMQHGIENPNIMYKDSLSEDNEDSGKYTLVLANPPFKGSIDAERTSKDLLAVTKTKKTELLFLALFLRSLKIGGRCASIVPDGVLFGSSNAHKEIRKEIIENHKLEAIISMPSGVFKPYAGVSTAIMIFTKTTQGGTDKVWFYDMTADGFSLDDQRQPVKENDIPDIINRFNNRDCESEKNRERTEKSFFVSKEEIVKNDYDLSINKYKEIVVEKQEYEKPEIILKRVIDMELEIQQKLKELEEVLDG